MFERVGKKICMRQPSHTQTNFSIVKPVKLKAKKGKTNNNCVLCVSNDIVVY